MLYVRLRAYRAGGPFSKMALVFSPFPDRITNCSPGHLRCELAGRDRPINLD